MPRVLRKYEHVDFTSLLNEINGTCAKQPDAADVSTKPVPIAAVTEVSPERRRRDTDEQIAERNSFERRTNERRADTQRA